MSERATVTTIGVTYGRQQYRRYSNGEYQALMFGWWPDSNGTPSHRWRPIPVDKVPEAVRRLAEAASAD